PRPTTRGRSPATRTAPPPGRTTTDEVGSSPGTAPSPCRRTCDPTHTTPSSLQPGLTPADQCVRQGQGVPRRPGHVGSLSRAASALGRHVVDVVRAGVGGWGADVDALAPAAPDAAGAAG